MAKLTVEEQNARCAKLESQGAEIQHLEYVMFRTRDYDDVYIDFKGVPENHWLNHAITQAYFQGKEKGKQDLRDELNNLLGNTNA